MYAQSLKTCLHVCLIDYRGSAVSALHWQDPAQECEPFEYTRHETGDLEACWVGVYR